MTEEQTRGNMQFAQWPKDVPLPTDAEIEEAKKRHAADNIGPNGEILCYTDGALDLGWMMATYNRMCWWYYFFPEQKDACLKELWSGIAP
jgi:hypothetical protein